MTSDSTSNILTLVFRGTKTGEELDEMSDTKGGEGIVGYAKTEGDDNNQELLDELRE